MNTTVKDQWIEALRASGQWGYPIPPAEITAKKEEEG